MNAVFTDSLFQATTASQLVAALSVACLCGFTISLVYRWVYNGTSYSGSFVRSIIYLAMVTAVVMLVIGNNLARAFGLVGAMSIIRFRTAVKDPQDIVFVFFSLAVGLAAGVGLPMVALVSTFMVCVVIVVTGKLRFGDRHKRAWILQITSEMEDESKEAPYLAEVKRFCRSHQLINVRSREAGNLVDLTFLVELRHASSEASLTRALTKMPGVHSANVFFDDEN